MTKKIKTAIWHEKSLEANPFAPKESYLYGENYFRNVVSNHTFTELSFFTVTGKKASPKQRKWFDVLLNLGANPGIRDESTRAAMNCAVAKGPPINSLLVGLLARSGENRGGRWIEKVMDNLTKAFQDKTDLPDFAPFSGLGMHFGAPDQRAIAAVEFLTAKKYWGKYSEFLQKSAGKENPVLLEGIIAAGFLDIGLTPVQGSLLFLFSSGPAYIAFALEQWELGYKEFPAFFGEEGFSYNGPTSSSRETK